MNDHNLSPRDEFGQLVIPEFWHTYYSSLRRVHEQEGRAITAPVRDRNLGTTDARHVSILENYCRGELAQALGVPASEVGSRVIRFRDHRSKSFDVCWPLTGDPKILVSVKSMQNAYRNFTNRIEEAFGDSAVLRVYKSNACFGFFFFIVDGPVARGVSEMARPPARLDARGKPKKTKGVHINLALVEEGGDFFDLSDIENYRDGARKPSSRGRKDVIQAAQSTLTDLVVDEPSATSSIHYDAMAFVPARISRIASSNQPSDWKVDFSDVERHLAIDSFFDQLVATARLRGFVD